MAIDTSTELETAAAEGFEPAEDLVDSDVDDNEGEGEEQTGEAESSDEQKASGPKRRYLTGEPTEGFGLPRAMYSVYLEENLEGDAASFQIPDYLAALKALVGKKHEGALSVFERIEKTKEGEVKGVHIYVGTPATIEGLQKRGVRTTTPRAAKPAKVQSYKQISGVLTRVLALVSTSTEIHAEAKAAEEPVRRFAARRACVELNLEWASLVAKAHEFGIAEDLDLPEAEQEAAA